VGKAGLHRITPILLKGKRVYDINLLVYKLSSTDTKKLFLRERKEFKRWSGVPGQR
jgi:hypothetical protein